MASEHFLWADEASWGQFATPNKAIPVRSAGINPETTFMESNVTGGGRGRRPGAPGEIAVNGPMETILYTQDLGYLIRTFMQTRAKVAAGTGWKNKLLPDYEQANDSVSIQKRYSSTRAESIKGAKVNVFTLGARSREYATARFEFAAKDAVATGGQYSDGLLSGAITSNSIAAASVVTTTAAHGLETGDYVTIAGNTGSTPTINGTFRVTVLTSTTFSIPITTTVGGTGGTFASVAPPVVDPVPYTSGLRDGMKFYQGELIIGGTVALTAGELVVTGGAARCEIDNVEISCNFNLATDAYGLCIGDRTTQSMDEGLVELSARFDPNFSVVGFEFYNAWRNGDPAVLQLHFLGTEFDTGFQDEIKVTLPYVLYTNAANPEINAEYGVKRSTVEANAYVDPTLLIDWGIVWQTSQDLTV